jgi:uncharacterized OB-fold protein
MAADDLKQLTDRAMEIEVAEYGDEASKEFYRLLKNREFKTTRCRSCGDTALPPRMFCPSCFGTDVEWIDLPKRGRLFAFTQQERALRFNKPDVIGIVELEGAGRMITRVDAALDDLAIDMEVEMDFFDVSENQTLHQFRLVR